jgi:hypothetical protein
VYPRLLHQNVLGLEQNSSSAYDTSNPNAQDENVNYCTSRVAGQASVATADVQCSCTTAKKDNKGHKRQAKS